MGMITRYLQQLLFIVFLLATSSCYADVVTPNLLGLSLEDAKKALQSRGLSLGAIQNQRTDRPTGTVIVQAPPANKQVKRGYPVRLVIAIPLVKPKTTKVPNLKGMSLSQAKAAIASANLVLGSVKKRKIKMETEEVLYQSPKAGKGIVIKSRVNLTISDPITISGPRVKVLVDKTRFKSGESTVIRASVSNADMTKSAEYGFSINGRTHYSKSSSYKYTFPKAGKYILTASFRYARGKWHASLSKTVRVSAKNVKSNNPDKTSNEKKKTDEKKSSPDVKVPNVIGLSLSSARKAIEKAGLRVGNITEKKDKSGKKRILQQTPKANKRVKKGSKVNLTKSVPIPEPWQKPNAVISPSSIEVIQGKKARFYSQSSQDKAAQISLSWTSKTGQKTTGKKFKVDTSKLRAGKYWIKLSIKDNKDFSDTASAALIVLAKPLKVEKDKQVTERKPEIEPPTTESDRTNETKDTEKEVINSAVENKLRAKQKQTENKPPKNVDSDYIEALTIEANNTTQNKKSTLSSETTTQQQSLPSTIAQNKVSSQSLNQESESADLIPIKSNPVVIEKSSTTVESTVQKAVEKTALPEKGKTDFPWFIWLWLLVVLIIFGTLLLIIWGYRQRHHAEAPNIDFQAKSDAGEQEILMDPQSPLNSIHFNSQADKGEQQVSLDTVRSLSENGKHRKSDDENKRN